MLNVFYFIGVAGLLSIITGTLLISSKPSLRRRYTYPLLLFGGVCLLIYSVYIRDTVFIILQAVYIVITIYGIIRLHHHIRKVSDKPIVKSKKK